MSDDRPAPRREAFRAVERHVDFRAGNVACTQCGRVMYLAYNGGQLDEQTCCGRVFRTEHGPIDLVIYERLQ